MSDGAVTATRARTAAPRLVATDLDGTLLRSDGTISARTRAVLDAVVAAGVPLVLVTGRAPRSLGPVVAATGHRAVAVCANGAVRWDPAAERALHQQLLPAAVARAVTDDLRAALPGLVFAVERPDRGFGHEPGYTPSRPWPHPPRPVGELVADGAVTVLGHHPTLPPDELLARALPVVAGRAAVTASSSRSFVELNAPGVDKATGLASLAAELGVPAADVVAFGDMPNDLPMLRWAGRAVAVAGAHRDVLAVADEVAAGHDEDGVAEVLARWFPAAP
ncbi:Cof-type HAD-IIB family hydrolase [Rhodococcus aerolatus]